MRKIAEAASEDGFWEAGTNAKPPRAYAIMAWNAPGEQRIICDGIEKWSQAVHVAAFDPETVLKLLKRIEDLESKKSE